MRKNLFLCFLLFSVISCTKYDDISIVDVRVDNISFQSTSQILLTLGVKVDNPTKKTLVLREGILEVFRNEQNLATMTVSDPAIVAPKSNEYNKLVVQVRAKDLMALYSMSMSGNISPESFDVEGFLKIKAGTASRKMKIDRMNLNDLLQSLK